MPIEFIPLEGGGFILRRVPEPEQLTAWQRFRRRIGDFFRGLRPPPEPPKLPSWMIEADRQRAAEAAQRDFQPLPLYDEKALLQAFEAPPGTDPWEEIRKEVETRQRIVTSLGEFPRRMLESPLVEGRWWR
jgi:hypothetical protein